MYAPHTVTIYNRITDRTTQKDLLYCTILRGVMLQASKGANVRKSGLSGADSATLYIPFDVVAVDGLTGEKKQYAGAQEFYKADNRDNLWTLSYSGNGGTTFFLKGEFVTDNEDVALMQDNHYEVTKVDAMDYGSLDMQHWEVGGI